MERPRRNGEASTPRRIASLSAARTPGASLVFVGGPGKPRGSGFARGGDLRQYQAMGASTPVTPAAAGEQAAVEVLVSFFTPASELPLFSRVYRRQHVDGRFVGAAWGRSSSAATRKRRSSRPPSRAWWLMTSWHSRGGRCWWSTAAQRPRRGLGRRLLCPLVVRARAPREAHAPSNAAARAGWAVRPRRLGEHVPAVWQGQDERQRLWRPALLLSRLGGRGRLPVCVAHDVPGPIWRAVRRLGVPVLRVRAPQGLHAALAGRRSREEKRAQRARPQLPGGDCGRQ